MAPTLLRPLSLLPALALTTLVLAQGPERGGPGGPGGAPSGRGGMPRNEQTKVLEQFDKNGDGRLDQAERVPAKAWLAENRPQRRSRGPGGGPGGPGGRRGPPGGAPEDDRNAEPPVLARKVERGDVANHAAKPTFDPDVVRTFFLEFEAPNWFEELSAFWRTDVLLPATVHIDGVTYRDVGVRFRGNTSFMMTRGQKKSFDLEFDFVNPDQSLHGIRNVDLLNCHRDASFLREALHGWIANDYVPAPRVALAQVVVNGTDFGIYAAAQAFDRDFTADHFGSKKGDRFKIPPDFSGNGGLRWLGDDPTAYERNYQLKSGANPAAWAALADLCAVLEHTPTADLERILPQHLDVDAALWFLAVDNAVADDDGYHSRASDYVIYRDPKGRFHPIARDNNEILLGERRGRSGRGGPGGGRGGGTASGPLAMADRDDRPLLRRLLEVPKWRARYLANLRELATATFTAEAVGARITKWHDAIAEIVKYDANIDGGIGAFEASFATDAQGRPAPGSLMATIEKRRAIILDDPAMDGSWPHASDIESTFAHNRDGEPALHVRCRVGESRIDKVWLHHDRGAFGAYASTAMYDDGRHGDGEAGDGVYAGWLPKAKNGDLWRYWVEAVATGSGHVDCLPAGAGAKPFRWTTPKN